MGESRKWYMSRFCKRLLDILASLIALVILLPLMLIIALAVKLTTAGPVLFSQRRAGLKGVPFNLLKFRTMKDLHDANGRLLADERRLTRFGCFLRSTSLDELPELINVLKGDMSLVGPRPLLLEYLGRYTPEQNRRHEVRPGITGWAQVNGRNALAWEQKFAYDLWYVEHGTMWLDARIMMMTLWKILRREGISQAGQATMEEFRGVTINEGGGETPSKASVGNVTDRAAR